MSEARSNLAMSVALLVLVALLGAARAENQAPRFYPSLQSNYFFPEYNATKPGDLLLWLNATDFDDDELQFGVEGGFYNKLIDIKRIDSKHAIVVNNQVFDREVQEKYENIVFYVKDPPGNKVYQSVRFVILDIDDNVPVFKNTPYKIDVSEYTPVNSVLLRSIEAIDADGPLYNKFEFTLSNKSIDNELFALDKTSFISSGHYGTSLILRNKLDYEKSKSHVVSIWAVSENNQQTTSTTEVVINVIDYPDRKPEFAQSPYYVKIEEEMPVGAFVLNVFAKDGDTGINNPCEYEILNEPGNLASSYFKIDKKTGNLYIRKRIDLESNEIAKLGGLLEFKIVAYEVGDERSREKTQVTVAIIDLNDNYPYFNSNSYNLSINPRSTVGTSLTLMNDLEEDSIRVIDLDKGINGSFSLILLRILEVNDGVTLYDNYTDFEVVPKLALNDANLIIKLKNPANLIDKIGMVEHYHLFAKDNGINGRIVHVNLHIHIEIINKYSPWFDREVFYFSVDENSVYNTTVGFLRAFDNDTFDNFGRLVYELRNGQERFQIDSRTGRIYTISENPNQQLDRELIDTFYLSVDAIDGGGLRTSVQVIVKLNDVNDNAPQFLNNLFNSGTTTLKSTSVYGAGWMSFNDTSARSTFTSTAGPKDSNSDNILVGFIEENADVWLETIRLQAFDRDIGLNGQIVYDIVDGDYFHDYFTIDAVSNTIVLKPNKTIDFEELYRLRTQYGYPQKIASLMPKTLSSSLMLNLGEIDLNLIVLASDLGTPSLSSKIIAKVVVKDVNDNKPKFEKLFYSTRILETAKFGDVYQVTAIDQDAPNTLHSKIVYAIESGNDREKFSIDASTGMVKIIENSDLDRDLFGSFYTLKITANDMSTTNSLSRVNSSASNSSNPNDKLRSLIAPLTKIKENVCYLMIEIIDVNNKKPEFSASNLKQISMYENVAKNTFVAQIKASDADVNSKLVYYFPSLRGDALSAQNQSSPSLSSMLGDERVEAFDELDRPVNESLVKDWFRIDSSNGKIYTKGALDRELAERIKLVIVVEDTNAAFYYRPQIKSTTLSIQLLDVNDNYPVFVGLKQLNEKPEDAEEDFGEEPVYELFESIEENSKINTKLTQLKVTDLDKSRDITYKIAHSTHKQPLLVINETTGDIFVNGLIDYETTKWINLTIIAFDSGEPRKHALLHFYCHIEDVNDNEPKFARMSTTDFSIREDARPGTLVAQFKASDADSGEFGSVFYRILSGDEGKFRIDSQTGVLYLKEHIDREIQDLYTIVIQARDNPAAKLSQQLSDSLVVKIRVIDVNDNTPYCDRDFYTVETVQNVDVNTSLIQIKGFDADAGHNAQIFYSLRTNVSKKFSAAKYLFKINSTNGIIQTNRKLLGHAGVYIYSVILTDFGPRSPNTTALRSGARPGHIGNCTVRIVVKDFNAHPPRFIFPNYNNSTIRIKSSLELGSFIAYMNATDPDKGTSGEVLFNFEERTKNTDWKCFNLDSKTGLLTLNTNLNQAKQSVYIVDVIASDLGKPTPLTSRMTLTIIVVDDSDNAALFNKMQICLSSAVSGSNGASTSLAGSTGQISCEKDYKSLIVHLREEDESQQVQLNLARIIDVNRQDDEICYYLQGADKDHFSIDKHSGVLRPRFKLDRERRDRYELYLRASEYCYCDMLEKLDEDGPEAKMIAEHCKELVAEHNFLREHVVKQDENYTRLFEQDDDVSRLKLSLIVDDINDNAPKFNKKLYRVGITSDTAFGEIILESFATDLDTTSVLNFSIIPSSLLKYNYFDASELGGGSDSGSTANLFPFLLEYFETKTISNVGGDDDYFENQNVYNSRMVNRRFVNGQRFAKFRVKTQSYFRDQRKLSSSSSSYAASQDAISINRNTFFQFNISVSDENEVHTDIGVIQVFVINKQQRVKLVFSQPIEKVIGFQDEFQAYISNLTGFKANIDQINVHREDDEEEGDVGAESDEPPSQDPNAAAEDFPASKRRRQLTDMLLHFIQVDSGASSGSQLGNSSNATTYGLDADETYTSNDLMIKYIVNADTILSLLDRSKDSALLRKYRLSLAEKYDDNGASTFYKYGSSSIDDEFGSFFVWSPNNLNKKTYTNYLIRLILCVTCLVLLFICSAILIICCFMKQKYRRKLKAERAMVKAFGLERSYDAISGSGGSGNGVAGEHGFLNSAFDSNSLLPIPGTNLYAYEGANPIWLKKYDKIIEANAKNHAMTSTGAAFPSSGSASTSSSASTTSSNSSSSEPSTSCCSSKTKLHSKDATNLMKLCGNGSYGMVAGRRSSINASSKLASMLMRTSSSFSKHKQHLRHVGYLAAISNQNDEISSFYLKQVDSTPATSRCSPASSTNQLNNKNFGLSQQHAQPIQNVTINSSDIFSYQESISSPDNSKLNGTNNTILTTTGNNMSTNAGESGNNSGSAGHQSTTTPPTPIATTTSSFKVDTLLTFASSAASLPHNQQQQQSVVSVKNKSRDLALNPAAILANNSAANNSSNVLYSHVISTLNNSSANSGNFTKIFESFSSQADPGKQMAPKASLKSTSGGGGGVGLGSVQQQSAKDYCDLFAVESTVI